MRLALKGKIMIFKDLAINIAAYLNLRPAEISNTKPQLRPTSANPNEAKPNTGKS